MLKNTLFICFTFLLLTTANAQEAIFNACKTGDLDSVKKLLTSNPALLNAKDKSGLTPLHYGSTKSLEVVIYLIDKGADVNARSKSGATPLYSAARFGQTAIAKYLLEHKADINAKSDGGSVMHQAAYRSPKPMVELLLSYKPDLTITDKEGRTCIHAAAIWNVDSVLQLLITAGGDINAKDMNGNTPLHLSLTFIDERSNYVSKSAKVLIKNNVLVNERNNAGLTPLGLAIQKGATEMVRFLSEAGARE